MEKSCNRLGRFPEARRDEDLQRRPVCEEVLRVIPPLPHASRGFDRQFVILFPAGVQEGGIVLMQRLDFRQTEMRRLIRIFSRRLARVRVVETWPIPSMVDPWVYALLTDTLALHITAQRVGH